MEKTGGLSENVLLKRFLFTIVALLVYRLGVHIPIPGVNSNELLETINGSSAKGVYDMFNMFSGGALQNSSILILGIFPYITASILIQVLSVMSPQLEQWQKEGGTGKSKMNRLTRTLALVIALFQGFLAAQAMQSNRGIVLDPGITFSLFAALLLAGGTLFIMWLGEQITEKGLGNGSSVLIFAGIVAAFPKNAQAIFADLKDGKISPIEAGLIAFFAVLLVYMVALIEQSYRKIPIHYARRSIGSRSVSGQISHLPVKVNLASVIPAIFASTLIGLIATLRGTAGNVIGQHWFDALIPNNWLSNILFALLVLFFCFFYTSLVFKPDDIAENLKKQNAYIPGIRPGVETASALDMVVTRLTLAGAIYMNLICLVPVVIFRSTENYQFNLGGTSLLIVVGVGLDTVRLVSAHLATQRYDTLDFFGPKDK